MSDYRSKVIWQSFVFSVALLVVCLAFYINTSQLLFNKTRQVALTMARAGALSIDVENLLSITGSVHEGSAPHQRVKLYLQSIRDLHPATAYVYVVQKTSKEGIVSFWVDAEEDPNLVSAYGDEYNTAQSPKMWEAFFGQAVVERTFTYDEWGKWLSAYAPIMSAENEVLAVLGVDIDADYIIARDMRYFLYTLGVFVFVCALGLFLLHRSTLQLGTQVNSLSTSLKEKEDSLTQQSKLDQLTGLHTHTAFHEVLEESCCQDNNCCLMVLDIDDLNRINEVYGYEAGDRVLKIVATILKSRLGEHEIAARTGGSEFRLILASSAQTDIAAWYESLRLGLMQQIESIGIPFYASVGAACYSTGVTGSAHLSLLAEEALLRAKRLGGNRMALGGTVIDPMANIPAYGALLGLVSAVDNKDKYTLYHSEQVSTIAFSMAEAMGMDEMMSEIIKIAGLLHDVGKIAVPDHVLRKPGALSPEERAVVLQHPVFGSRLIQDIPHSREIAEIILHHHERWDGTGYPHHLQGTAIPLGARILAVADSYSAMTTDRPYRPALAHAHAIAQLELGAGTQYDPSVVSVLVNLLGS